MFRDRDHNADVKLLEDTAHPVIRRAFQIEKQVRQLVSWHEMLVAEGVGRELTRIGHNATMVLMAPERVD